MYDNKNLKSKKYNERQAITAQKISTILVETLNHIKIVVKDVNTTKPRLCLRPHSPLTTISG